ncbi:molybdopterin dinucleotide binding domain-containing protein [Chloracidobacterium aggregatum]|uniref:molybdopterin dinucleotide binding domain-containing protein n=1 Tax=Chloracidobacterium aggregatum TaxID=2851959 RepID=UPI00387EC2E3
MESPRGRLTGTVLLWEGIREDVIFIPNSFGEAQLVGDEVDTPRYAPANILVDDAQYDNLSGQQAYKCFACRIGKVT